MKNRLIFILLFLVLPMVCFGQYTSIDVYTGSWTSAVSWVSSMPPLSGVNGNTSVFGEINTGADLGYQSGILTVVDTLVIDGNLTLGNNADLALGGGAVLIILGDLYVGNKVDIAAGGTVIIQGGLHFSGSSTKGSFTSEQEPAQVYIGGEITGNPPTSSVGDAIPVIDCSTDSIHTNSTCNYGLLIDLEGEDIEEYFQEVVCGVGVNPGSIGFSQEVCEGGSVAQLVELTASSESVFQWFSSTNSLDPDVPIWVEIVDASQQDYDPGILIQTTSYYRRVKKGNGCTADSNVVTVTIVDFPAPIGVFHE